MLRNVSLCASAALVWLAAASSGCNGCRDEGTTLQITVDVTAAVGPVDQLDVTVTAGGSSTPASYTPTAGATFTFPVTLPDLALAANSGTATVAVNGLFTGTVVADGSSDVALAPGVVTVLVVLDAPASCGNGVVDGVEECDDGNTTAGDGCENDCTLTPATCGDGTVQPPEQCDDGNTVPGDGCDDSCMLEGSCGNGVIDGAEECDGADLGIDDCTTLGFSGGTLSCDADCLFDTSACSSMPGCGNGTLDAGEECDDGNMVSGDGCSASCLAEGPCTGVDCSSLDDACNVGACEPTSGACIATPRPDGTACDDGLFCVVGEACVAGVCGGGAARDCGDANACTVDSCDEAASLCVNDAAPLAGSACNDGLFCTVGETCTAGACSGGTANPCSDGNGCTTDSCDEAADACVGTPVADGTVCAAAGGCFVGGSCTAGACSAVTPAPPGSPCDDASQCTSGDACDGAGGCSGAPVVCNDLNACTTDSCDPAAGCQFLAVADGTACDDGLFCTSGTTCTAAACGGGAGTSCADANSCTADSCDEAANACANDGAPLAGVACNDGLFCTLSETCNGAGSCGGGTPNACPDGNQCTSDVCDEAADACVNAASPPGTPCNDGLFCNDGETCTLGVCGGGAPRDCSPVAGTCTAPSCDEAGDACVAVPLVDGTPCRASSGACDVAEACAAGLCPADGFATGSICRASAGACDVVETCTGLSADCPPDALADTATSCRLAAGSCDVAEFCTGATAACPADAFVPSGVCRLAAGVCDVAESCTGASADCPPDGFAPGGTVCRVSAGACDVAETCVPSMAACPADGFAGPATVCRGAVDLCDAPESCPGTSVDCPADALQPPGTPCRGAAGSCDAAESCTGGSTACPADGALPDGTACTDASVCTDDICVAGACGIPIGNSCDIYTALVGGFIDLSQSPTATLLATISADNTDDAVQPVVLPFAFPFFGTAGTGIGVATNGFINVGAGASTEFTNASIPSALAPNDIIAPFWDDLNSFTSGDVLIDYRGTSPNQIAIIQWHDYGRFGSAGTLLNFEAILHENGVIQFLYAPSTLVSGATAYHRGADATAGIEDATGTTGLQYSFNTASLDAGLIVDFLPDGAGGYVMTSENNLVGSWTDVRTTGTLQATASNCDDCSQPFTLPFVFNYLGTSYGPGQAVTVMHVHSNGFVQFAAVASTGAPTYTNVSLPSAAAPPGLAGCFWDDLNTTNTFAAGSEIRVATVGAAPNRRVVVQWIDVPLFSSAAPDLNFELVLYETTNRIECIIGPSVGAAAAVNGSSATSGLNNSTGTAGALASFNTASLGQGAVVDFIPTSNAATTAYVVRGPNNEFPDISRDVGVSTLVPADDTCTSAPLGFTFNYYGTDYTSAFICDNGHLAMDAGTTLFANTTIPSAAAPNAIVAPFWNDLLMPTNPGIVYYRTSGVAPTRIWTVMWQSANDYSGAPSPATGVDVTFAVQFFETTNEVRFFYGGMLSMGDVDFSGSSSTIGIENGSGLSGIEIGADDGGTCLSGSRMVFVP